MVYKVVAKVCLLGVVLFSERSAILQSLQLQDALKLAWGCSFLDKANAAWMRLRTNPMACICCCCVFINHHALMAFGTVLPQVRQSLHWYNFTDIVSKILCTSGSKAAVPAASSTA